MQKVHSTVMVFTESPEGLRVVTNYLTSDGVNTTDDVPDPNSLSHRAANYCLNCLNNAIPPDDVQELKCVGSDVGFTPHTLTHRIGKYLSTLGGKLCRTPS